MQGMLPPLHTLYASFQRQLDVGGGKQQRSALDGGLPSEGACKRTKSEDYSQPPWVVRAVPNGPTEGMGYPMYSIKSYQSTPTTLMDEWSWKSYPIVFYNSEKRTFGMKEWDEDSGHITTSPFVTATTVEQLTIELPHKFCPLIGTLVIEHDALKMVLSETEHLKWFLKGGSNVIPISLVVVLMSRNPETQQGDLSQIEPNTPVMTAKMFTFLEALNHEQTDAPQISPLYLETTNMNDDGKVPPMGELSMSTIEGQFEETRIVPSEESSRMPMPHITRYIFVRWSGCASSLDIEWVLYNNQDQSNATGRGAIHRNLSPERYRFDNIDSARYHLMAILVEYANPSTCLRINVPMEQLRTIKSMLELGFGRVHLCRDRSEVLGSS